MCAGRHCVKIGNVNEPVLLYAADAVFLAENAGELQRMLDHLECMRSRK